MEKLFEQLKQVAKQVLLTKDEKSQQREKLLNFMSAYPARSISLARQQRAWSNILSVSWRTRPVAVFATILLAIFAVGGGVSFASQGSLPGDTLYPIKLKTEEIRSVLAFSTEAKAKLESELAQTRLTEAETLSNESKLDTNTRTEIENSFEKHAKLVATHTATLASTDAKAAAGINSNLVVSLKKHNRTLSKLAKTKDGKVGPEINKLLIKIQAETDNADKNKNDEESNIKIQPQINTQPSKSIKLDVRFNSERNNETEDMGGVTSASHELEQPENSESD